MDYDAIYRLVRKIPKGKITTYGRIAAHLELTSPRIVGRALHLNPDSGLTPCHRVVNSTGRLAPAYAFGGDQAQAKRLKTEGVETHNHRVDLKKYLWEPGIIGEEIGV